MGLFFKKKEEEKKSYDPARQKPVIRASICNGEKVAGFKDIETGAFSEVMLVRGTDDLESFCRMYGITKEMITTEY